MTKSLNIYYLSLKNNSKFFRENLSNENVFFARFPILKNVHSQLIRKIIWKICCFVDPIISLIVITVQLIPYLVRSCVVKPQPIEKQLFIDNCPLLRARAISAGVYDTSVDWLYSFSVHPKKWDKQKRCHSIFEYVSFIDVIWSYLLSFWSVLTTPFIIRFKYVLGTYSCFEYFLTYFFLQNISDDITLCFCNQVDRWAVLFDRAPQKNKILFQHGIEALIADWPVKFEHTNTAYVFSEKEAQRLFKAAFKVNPQNVFLLPPTIKLEPISQESKISVLIVGYPGYGLFDRESFLIKSLQSDDILLFFKPHPGKHDISRYEELKKEFDFVLILDQLFPDVDIVISYQSTLAVEYLAYNKKVLFYEDNSVDEIVEKVKESRD